MRSLAAAVAGIFLALSVVGMVHVFQLRTARTSTENLPLPLPPQMVRTLNPRDTTGAGRPGEPQNEVPPEARVAPFTQMTPAPSVPNATGTIAIPDEIATPGAQYYLQGGKVVPVAAPSGTP